MKKQTINIQAEDLSDAVQLLNTFNYEADEDSCMGMSFFTARLPEDGFFSVKFKLERLLEEAKKKEEA